MLQPTPTCCLLIGVRTQPQLTTLRQADDPGSATAALSRQQLQGYNISTQRKTGKELQQEHSTQPSALLSCTPTFASWSVRQALSI
jgi:hypothetical protein